MPDTHWGNSPIVAAYRERTAASRRLAARAREVFPSGLTHDSRHLEPYGIYVADAGGPCKRDVDGNRYVDYFGGHGALLLGHGHPQVTAAVREALERGTHFGAGHELEVEWGEAVQRLVPCAERVRFTSSGTEATHMALRLARAYTGRRKVVRFRTHFHGWHDHMTSGFTSHFDGTPTAGVLPPVAESVVLLDPGDVAGLREALERDDDIAAVILEPTGGSFGMTPLAPEVLGELRRATAEHGVVLVFDEVISGFRVAPGGAQARFGVTPDLATFAKVLAGGLPGGAVAGRREVMELLDFAAARERGLEKIQHQGTFNANPVSAAAGVAALRLVAETDACERARAHGEQLHGRLNHELAARGVAWALYGTYSGFHLFMNPEGRALDPTRFDPGAVPYEELKAKPARLVHKLRLAMLVHGVDISSWPGGLASAAHGEAELEAAAAAFAAALDMLGREEELPRAG